MSFMQVYVHVCTRTVCGDFMLIKTTKICYGELTNNTDICSEMDSTVYYVVIYHKSGNFRCKNTFVVGGDYEN